MTRLATALLVGLLLVHACAFAELPWQVPERTHRLLVIPQTRLAPRSAHAPAVVDMQAVRDVNPASVRAFAYGTDSEATTPVIADFAPARRELLLHDPHCASTLAYVVYFSRSGVAGPATRDLPEGKDYVVERAAYRATVQRTHGHLSSLVWTGGKEPVETLGEGVYWQFQRSDSTMVRQDKVAALKVQLLEQGAVRTVVRATYDDPLAAGNALSTTYLFYPLHVEVEQHYVAHNAAESKWIKFFCSLAGLGTTPGFHSSANTSDVPLLTAGKSVWNHGRWRDVSYAQGFGLAAVGLEGNLPVWNMDSAKPAEHETLYTEPLLGWGKALPVTKDIRARVAYIPHGPGRGNSKLIHGFFDTAAYRVSAVQERGGPQIDTDGDGVADLTELARQWDPFTADMDLDGLPDGRDANALRAEKLLPAFHFQTREPSGRKAHAGAADLPDCRVETVAGAPTLVVDGQPLGPNLYTGPHDPRQWERLSKAGFRVFFMFVHVSETRPGQFSYRPIDRQVRSLIRVAPDALVIFRIFLPPTARFANAHPGECLAWEGGRYAPYQDDQYLDRKLGKYSFASDVWREEAAAALEGFAKHVTGSDYRRHVAGYFVTGGGTGEWYNWPRPNHLIDFSPAMTRAFRRWLHRHYQGDVQKLRAAWRDPSVCFATAQVPSRRQREAKEFASFLTPTANPRTIDYLRCHSDVLQDKLIYFSRVLKEVSAGRSLVGFFYGYLQCMDFILGGQSSFKEMLRCPTVDFWSTPPPYENRGVGDHAPYRFPIRSVQRHNKLWVSEDDIRTHSSGKGNIRYGGTGTVEEACEGLKRSFGQVLCNGVNAYWFEMGKGWYDHPKVLGLFTSMQQIGSAAATVDKRRCADIAVVVHQQSLWVASPQVTFNLIDRFRIHELCRIGAPYDYWELADLLNTPDDELEPYKLVLFLTAFNVSDAERRAIDAKLKSDGRVLVWFYAPGLILRDVGASLSNMKQLTGLDFEFIPGQQSQEVSVAGPGLPARLGLPISARLGVYSRPITTGFNVDEQRTPIAIKTATVDGLFAVTGANATVLGHYSANGKVGFALQELPGWRSVFIGSLGAPSSVLRALAKFAGCHVYGSEDDIIYASRRFLTIHTMHPGTRRIALPRRVDVYDMFERRPVATQTTEFEITIPGKSTRLFYLGRAADIEARLATAAHGASARLERLEKTRKTEARNAEKEKATRTRSSGPFTTDADGFVCDFLLCGPFPNPKAPRDKGLTTDYLTNIGGEAKCRPSDGADGFAAWHTPNPLVYIHEHPFGFATDQQVCYYVCCYVDLPGRQMLSVDVGSDDGYRLWFDGQMLGSMVAQRGLAPDSNIHEVEAAAGRHRVLLKVEQGGGPTGFCLRLTDAHGMPLSKAKVWLGP